MDLSTAVWDAERPLGAPTQERWARDTSTCHLQLPYTLPLRARIHSAGVAQAM